MINYVKEDFKMNNFVSVIQFFFVCYRRADGAISRNQHSCYHNINVYAARQAQKLARSSWNMG